MKCALPGVNARVLAKAVNSLSKIGSELFIEATKDGLSMRAVNNTKSAFAFFRFFPSFFTDYHLESDSQDEFDNKCKVSMKAFLKVFKNMKQVEHCKIKIDSKNSKLVMQLKCRLETMKTHLISIIDVETLQAAYVTDNVPNKITANHKFFGEIISNFHGNVEEITLEAFSDKLFVKNYVDLSHDARKFVRSQLNLDPSDFDKYSVKEETSITFCLREFRAFLLFAEAINLDIIIHFITSGQPLVIILNNLQTFEANLVMSTLSPEEEDTSTNKSCTDNKSNNETNITKSLQKRCNNNEIDQISTKKPRIETENINEQNNFTFQTDDLTSIELLRAEPSELPLISKIYDKTNNESGEIISTNKSEECSGIDVTFKNTEETNHELNVEESIPKSPTSIKKLRARKVFKRCFEATFDPMDGQTSNQILAKNSDTED